MAIACISRGSDNIKTVDVRADLGELKVFLSRLRGKKFLTFEETTTSQWLYTELKNHAEETLVCDPLRNRLLSEGPKTDRIDAEKLVTLLKAGLLKPVYHSGDKFFELRKFLSGYGDIVKSGVRMKNQRDAILRGSGTSGLEGIDPGSYDRFVIEGLDRSIKCYEEDKRRYEQEFRKICKENKLIGRLSTIPGIGAIGAVKIAGIVVDPKRFKDKSAWLSYCGLVRHDKISGGRSYGKKKTRYCRAIKSVFKTAAISVLRDNAKNVFKRYYDYLIGEKGYPEHDARHAVARRIAVITLGVFKENKKFEDRWL
jgi:transposase